MKITILSTNAQVQQDLKKVLEKLPPGDEATYLTRKDHLLELDRIDLDATNILIIDSIQVEPSDLKVISNITLNRVKPAVFYLCQSYSEQQLIDLMRAGISEVIHLPLNGGTQALLDAVERVRLRSGVTAAYKTRAKVLSFISCKGGAGATVVATNVGYALGEFVGKKVLLIDLHTQYGDAAFHVSNMPNLNSLADIIKEPYLDSMMIVSTSMRVTNNFFVLQSSEHPGKLAGILPSHISNLTAIAAQDYDYVIFDLPNTLDGIVIQALDLSNLVYVVSNPTISYLKALTHMLRLFNELVFPPGKVNIVLNRLGHVGGLGEAKAQEVIGRDAQFYIPEDAAHIVESISVGSPVIKAYPEEGVSKSFIAMAYVLSGQESKPKKKSFLNSIFSQ
jgi:pilus assembly protein CpaE